MSQVLCVHCIQRDEESVFKVSKMMYIWSVRNMKCIPLHPVCPIFAYSQVLWWEYLGSWKQDQPYFFYGTLSIYIFLSLPWNSQTQPPFWSEYDHLLLLQYLFFLEYQQQTFYVPSMHCNSWNTDPTLQTPDDRNTSELLNLLAGQYLCSRALWMCIESEGAERCLQHQLFSPEQKLSSTQVFSLRKETGEHMGCFISSRFTLVFFSW